MLSINEIKRRMPDDFINEMEKEYTPVAIDNILRGMTDERFLTLRVNTIKFDIQSLMKYFREKNIKFDRVPWYTDALIIKNAKEKEIQKLDIYEKGYIYFQSLSSMIPPLVLNPKPGEKILDMAAAPGSKTTQIAALMQNNGFILANELDKIRLERLKYNITMQGADIVETINRRGEKLGEEYREQFDKVLLDVPCSGEGRFIATKANTYKNWSLKRVNELTKLQKKLFESGYYALKKGGILVYSTCTVNQYENEKIVEWAIKNFDVKLLNIEIDIKEAIGDKYKKILPSKTMEGFFVAKFWV